jgi:hypothetical protein
MTHNVRSANTTNQTGGTIGRNLSGTNLERAGDHNQHVTLPGSGVDGWPPPVGVGRLPRHATPHDVTEGASADLLAMRLNERLQTYKQKIPAVAPIARAAMSDDAGGAGRDTAVQWAISADALRAHENSA